MCISGLDALGRKALCLAVVFKVVYMKLKVGLSTVTQRQVPVYPCPGCLSVCHSVIPSAQGLKPLPPSPAPRLPGSESPVEGLVAGDGGGVEAMLAAASFLGLSGVLNPSLWGPEKFAF